MHDLARRSPSIAATSILLATLLSGRSADAQNAEAATLFDQGDKLMTEGKVVEACEAFEGSNRIEPRAGTLIRLGECREKNHQLASAWSAYKDALNRVKDPNKKAIATAKVAELEPKLSYLTISVPSETRTDGLSIARNDKPVDAALWDRALPIDGGEYVISVRAPGSEEWKTTVTVPVDGGKVGVDVPRLKKVPAPPPPVTEPTLPTVVDHDTSRPGLTSQRKLAIGVAGVGVLSLATGVIFGTQAKGKQNDAFALCPDPQMPCTDANQANALIDSAQNRALGANIMFGVAALVTIGAGVLWFTGAPEAPPQHVAIVPVFAPGGSGLGIAGSF
jgi:hypothetical protein